MQLDRKNGASNICLTTSYDLKFAYLGDWAALTHRIYARHFGYPIYVDTKCECERTPFWTKIILVPQLFDMGFEYVMWIDADAIFVSFERDIAEVITGDHDLYLVQHDSPDFKFKIPNTGVMLVRNSPWSRNLFERIWNENKYPNAWDNEALLKVLGYHGVFDRNTPNELNEDMISHIKFIDCEWNFMPQLCSGGKPVIMHYNRGSGASSEVLRAIEVATKYHSDLLSKNLPQCA